MEKLRGEYIVPKFFIMYCDEVDCLTASNENWMGDKNLWSDEIPDLGGGK